MNEAEIRKIAAKYYPADKISEVKILGRRVIIELSGVAENTENTAQLKVSSLQAN